MIKALVSGLVISVCLIGSEAKASTFQTKSLTLTPHTVVISESSHKSYKIDSTYDNDSVLFVNESNVDVIIRMNGSMFFIIAPGKTGVFWKNGGLWVLGHSA